jgi:hypothetical protein
MSSGISKFFADFADQVSEPYLVFEEVGETYGFDTHSPSGYSYRGSGQVVVRIFEDDRTLARQLGVQVCNVLNDCEQPLGSVQWPGNDGPCTLISFRMSSASFQPVPSPGPNVPATFNRVIVFDYVYEGAI